jgi:hypothetical protein
MDLRGAVRTRRPAGLSGKKIAATPLRTSVKGTPRQGARRNVDPSSELHEETMVSSPLPLPPDDGPSSFSLIVPPSSSPQHNQEPTNTVGEPLPEPSQEKPPLEYSAESVVSEGSLSTCTGHSSPMAIQPGDRPVGGTQLNEEASGAFAAKVKKLTGRTVTIASEFVTSPDPQPGIPTANRPRDNAGSPLMERRATPDDPITTAMYDLLDVDCDGMVSVLDLVSFLTLYPSTFCTADSMETDGCPQHWPSVKSVMKYTSLRNRERDDAVYYVVQRRRRWYRTLHYFADLLLQLAQGPAGSSRAGVDALRPTGSHGGRFPGKSLRGEAPEDDDIESDAEVSDVASVSSISKGFNGLATMMSAKPLPPASPPKAFLTLKDFCTLLEKVQGIVTSSSQSPIACMMDLDILSRVLFFCEQLNAIAMGMKREQEVKARLFLERNPNAAGAGTGGKPGGLLTANRFGADRRMNGPGAAGGSGLVHLSTFAKATSFYLRKSISPSRSPSASPQAKKDRTSTVLSESVMARDEKGDDHAEPSPSEEAEKPAASKQKKKKSSEANNASSSSQSRFWLASAWEERRSVFGTPFALRFGELIIKRRAEGQEREMKHFVRLYRHIVGVQQSTSTKDQDRLLALSTASSGRRPFQQGPGHGLYGLGKSSTATATTLSVSELQKKESIDSVLRHLAKPEPLSMLGELSESERKQMRRERRNSLIQACLIGLVAAVTIGLIEVLSAQLFLGSKEQFGDGFVRETSAAWDFVYGQVSDWIHAGHKSSLNGSTNSSSMTVNSSTPFPSSISPMFGNQTNAPPVTDAPGVWDLGLSPQEGTLAYWLTVLLSTILISALEVTFLFTTSLNSAFMFARTAGIPLHHHTNLRSERFMRCQENEAVAIKESLTRKRVRFIISSISRAAMDLPQLTDTILGIQAEHRSSSAVLRFLARQFQRLRHSFITFIIRMVASRLLSKFAAPFLLTPLLMLWNVLIVRKNMDDAATVVRAAVGVEKLVRGVLEYHLGSSLLHVKDGAIYCPAPLYHSLVRLAAYCAFKLHTVPPALHLTLVSIVASCDPHHRDLHIYQSKGLQARTADVELSSEEDSSSGDEQDPQQSGDEGSDGKNDTEAAKRKGVRTSAKSTSATSANTSQFEQHRFAKDLILLLNDIERSSERRRILFGRSDAFADEKVDEYDILRTVVFPDIATFSASTPHDGKKALRDRLLLLSIAVVISISVNVQHGPLRPLLLFLVGEIDRLDRLQLEQSKQKEKEKAKEKGKVKAEEGARTRSKQHDSDTRPVSATSPRIAPPLSPEKQPLLAYVDELRERFRLGYNLSGHQVTSALLEFLPG